MIVKIKLQDEKKKQKQNHNKTTTKKHARCPCLDLIKPFVAFQVVVVLVGTNNHHSTADQLAEGIESVVWSVTSKLPSAKIIVLVRLISET